LREFEEYTTLISTENQTPACHVTLPLFYVLFHFFLLKRATTPHKLTLPLKSPLQSPTPTPRKHVIPDPTQRPPNTSIPGEGGDDILFGGDESIPLEE